MDETRRDEPRENHRRAGSDPRTTDERLENQPREHGVDRPGLTERERQERWPVG
jgi:hypothetical protein